MSHNNCNNNNNNNNNFLMIINVFKNKDADTPKNCSEIQIYYILKHSKNCFICTCIKFLMLLLCCYGVIFFYRPKNEFPFSQQWYLIYYIAHTFDWLIVELRPTLRLWDLGLQGTHIWFTKQSKLKYCII